MNTLTKSVVVLAVCATLLPNTARADDADVSVVPEPSIDEVDVNSIEDFEGWTVYHWTSSGASTEGLDANVAGNRDIANFAVQLEQAAPTDTEPTEAPNVSTLDIDPPPPPPPPPGGFSCSTLVGPTELDGFEDQLETDVGQTCIGDFIDQWMGAQFQRSSWTGYRNYGGTAISDETFQQELDVRWTAPCGGGGTYDYRLFVISYAQSTDGTIVPSPGYTGRAIRAACGSDY